jgi:signal transduction histidine kinase
MKNIFLHKNFQLIYGLVLIVLVPVVIVINTINLNRNFQNDIDIQLQRQALAFGRLFNIALLQGDKQPTTTQLVIDRTLAQQKDIKAIQVLSFENENFRVIASSIPGQSNRQLSHTQYFFSWQQNEAIASLVSRQQLEAIFSVNVSLTETNNNRYWLVVMPLVDDNGTKQQLLAMAVSLEVMDNLIGSTLIRSYIFLTISIFIIILLLAANARLFEHAALYRKIKEVDEMKDEFISITSHELRTPLTIIKGYVSMLLTETGDTLTQEFKGYLNTISASTDRLAALVEDLLNVSRIEQGRLKIEMVKLDPRQIIDEVVKELKVEADKKNLQLHSQAIGKYEITADVARLKQALINLVGNAVKYTVSGSVEVKLQEKKGKVEIKIIDTGIGMSAQDRERLFQKFYRVRNEKTKNIIGTGLGLWITKQIVEMMRGQIYVDSIEGVGTQVSILFPMAAS